MNVRHGPARFCISDIATRRGSDVVMSSARRIASRSSGSPLPNTTRRITSSVSVCMRRCARTGVPGSHESSSSAASCAIVSRQRASASPWNGGSSRRRWRRCSAPSSRRIERGPANGSSTVELAPARSTDESAANTRLMSAGSVMNTIGASDQPICSVNGSP